MNLGIYRFVLYFTSRLANEDSEDQNFRLQSIFPILLRLVLVFSFEIFLKVPKRNQIRGVIR